MSVPSFGAVASVLADCADGCALPTVMRAVSVNMD